MGLTRIGLDRKTSFVRAKSLDQVPRAKTFRTDVSALLRRLWVLSCLKAEAATDEKGERESGPIAASRPASHREALGPPVEHKQFHRTSASDKPLCGLTGQDRARPFCDPV